MSLLHEVDRGRLDAAWQIARSQLLEEFGRRGFWVGELSSSPLATAAAVSALAIAEQHIDDDAHPGGATDRSWLSGVMIRNELSALLTESLRWLADRQNLDGGWGDAEGSPSTLAATMAVRAAFHVTGVPAKYAGLLERADAYIRAGDGVAGLKREHGKDKTLAAPILANSALAGLVPWSKVAPLPIELACLPRRWQTRVGLPVVTAALPAMAAVGLARRRMVASNTRLLRGVRSWAERRVLRLLEAWQAPSGGFFASTPITSFVVMNLASVGQADCWTVRRGVEFLLSSVRGDGSWPVTTDLAVRNTAQSLIALDWDFGDQSDPRQPSVEADRACGWLLGAQTSEPDAITGVPPGGWSWSDSLGAAPETIDTSLVLLALSARQRRWPRADQQAAQQAARRGVGWLRELQNPDGGFATFRRDCQRPSADCSAVEPTALAVRAIHAWRDTGSGDELAPMIRRGVEFVEREQHSSGAWPALWFGNPRHPEGRNYVMGTAGVLQMYDQLGRLGTPPALRAAHWLASVQQVDGGWGAADEPPRRSRRRSGETDEPPPSSVEETSRAIEALVPLAERDPQIAESVGQGVDWLAEVIESGRYIQPSPVGFYFAKLWYYERLYPQLLAVGALAKACRALGISRAHAAAAASG